jgi:hypothetical protein
MHIDLSPIEARLLLRHLEQHIQHLDTELVHTDKHQLQHSLALEIEALRAICEKFRADPQQMLPDLV